MGGPDYHNQPFHYAELAGILAGEAGADLRLTDDLAVLTPAVLADYQVIASFCTFLEPTREQVGALLAAIEGGTGFLALHGATATFWNSAAYLEMVGSRFVRHDPYKRFTVDIDDPAHPITTGVAPFEVEDELYELGGKTEEFAALEQALAAGQPRSELRHLGDGPLPDSCHMLASAEGHPLLYVKQYGRGRVHYNGLGHDTKALTSPPYRQLVRQGLAWVAGQA
jgi:type 1 glutamine amidotransferase